MIVVFKFPKKKFQISALSSFGGTGKLTDGHKLRQKLYYKQKKITNPIDFYMSQRSGIENVFENKVMADTFRKEELFNSQFHICIENSETGYSLKNR